MPVCERNGRPVASRPDASASLLHSNLGMHGCHRVVTKPPHHSSRLQLWKQETWETALRVSRRRWCQVLAVLTIAMTAACSHDMVAEPPPPAAAVKPQTADRVLVVKSARTLYLLNNNQVIERIPIALGQNPVGAKRERGDMRTPEGHYVLDQRNPKSQFYRSIRISYPNDEDRAAARKRGVSPGGDIMIHGLPNGQGHVGAKHRMKDWTLGCIAVTNEEMDVIWRMVKDNTPIEIRP